MNEKARIRLPEGVPALLTYYLYITNGCNLSCRHCWITPRFVDGKPSPGDCLDLNLLKSAVRQGKEMGLVHAKLTGGEPLLHPQFLEIVDYLSSEEIKLNMETNATMIDAKIADHLKNKSSMYFVSVSLDSPDAEKHDDFRGVKGAFRAAVSGLAHLVDVGFSPQIIMSVHRRNVNEVESMVRMAVEMGAGSVKLNPVAPTGRGKVMEKGGETLDFDEIRNLVRFARHELRDRYQLKIIISTPPALSTIKEILDTKDAGGLCSVRHILGILGDGETALCGIGRNIPELCFGNIKDKKIRGIWERHPALVQLRADLDGEFPGICGDCIHAQRCLTHCVAMNYERTGKLVHPFYMCEEAERRGVFPETRRRSYTPEYKRIPDSD